MLSAAKHLALLFLGGKVQSEILRSAPLRCAQNDSTAVERTRVTLSEAKNLLLAAAISRYGNLVALFIRNFTFEISKGDRREIPLIDSLFFAGR
jgi:hypothetical protein